MGKSLDDWLLGWKDSLLIITDVNGKIWQGKRIASEAAHIVLEYAPGQMVLLLVHNIVSIRPG